MRAVHALLLLALGADAKVPVIAAHQPVREYVIDLDAAPQHRYDHILADGNGFNATMWHFWDSWFAHDLVLRDLLFEVGKKRGPESDAEMQAEIEGLAASSKLPFQFVSAIQMLYELQTLMVPIVNFTGPAVDFRPPNLAALQRLPWRGPGCTGIIATCADGTVYHARNLDFAPLDIMSKLIYMATFKKGGQEVFKAQMVAGYTQAVTGMRYGPNGYTLERNTRYTTSWGGNSLMLKYLESGRQLNGWTLRKTLETIATYDDAVAHLSTAPYASTEYAIISGVKKGVILSRDPDTLAHTQTLGEGDDGQRADYVLMTNFDFFFNDKREFFDPTAGGGFFKPTRRGAAERVLKAVPEGQLTPEKLWEAINAKYVVADTVYQAVMNVETGYLNVSAPVFAA